MLTYGPYGYVLQFDGLFGPQWCACQSQSRNNALVGLSRAKSFGADLGGNKSKLLEFEATESIANEVKLKA